MSAAATWKTTNAPIHVKIKIRARARNINLMNSLPSNTDTSMRALSDQSYSGIGHSPYTPFAQLAEPMTAALADQRELTRQPSAFAAFQQGHFLSVFAAF
jgi:hypothetical protein